MPVILHRNFDRNRTIRSFKNVVWIYDFWSRLTEFRAAKEVLKLADIRDRQSVIEIACGTGILLDQISRKNPNGSNIGIDLSPDMLRKAKQRLENSGLHNYKLMEGNALALQFNDNSFDVLVNNFMIDLMPEETFDKIASEFFRILKPDGVAVISTFSFGTKAIHKFWFWIARNIPSLLTGCRPVSIKKNLEHAGFGILANIQISQNTFPSEIIKIKKISKI